jgi:hypothetical protein
MIFFFLFYNCNYVQGDSWTCKFEKVHTASLLFNYVKNCKT